MVQVPQLIPKMIESGIIETVKLVNDLYNDDLDIINTNFETMKKISSIMEINTRFEEWKRVFNQKKFDSKHNKKYKSCFYK